MDIWSSFGSGGGGSGGGVAGIGPSSSATASNNFGSGGDNSKLFAVLAVALVAVFGLVLALKK